MNETRKQIIELISDYMDKSLSEGCLIKTKEYGALFKIIDDVDNYMFLNNNSEVIDVDYRGERQSTIKEYKIIGHYDITAVLRYFKNSENCFGFKFVQGNINFIEVELLNEVILIPNKPLHLYTEQEDKQLLELLLKLNK